MYGQISGKSRNTNDAADKHSNHRSSCEPIAIEDSNKVDVELDDEDYSLERWQGILERTEEMRTMATNCSAIATHAVGDEVLTGLTEIIELIKTTKLPDIPDFKQVDMKIQKINELVGRAIDSYLTERRSGSGNAYKRMYAISKTIAKFTILVGVIAIMSEWLPY